MPLLQRGVVLVLRLLLVVRDVSLVAGRRGRLMGVHRQVRVVPVVVVVGFQLLLLAVLLRFGVLLHAIVGGVHGWRTLRGCHVLLLLHAAGGEGGGCGHSGRHGADAGHGRGSAASGRHERHGGHVMADAAVVLRHGVCQVA